MNKYMKNVIAAGTCLAVMTGASFVMTGCSKDNGNDKNEATQVKESTVSTDKLGETVAYTVGEYKVYMDEVVWYQYLIEEKMYDDAKEYKDNNNSSYYGVVLDEDGTTVKDKVLNEIEDQVSYYEIMYHQAVDGKNYTVDDDEIFKEQALKKLSDIDEDIVKEFGLTADAYERILKKWAYADLFYQDVTKLYDVDADKLVTDKYSDEDTRQYNTSYIFASYYSDDKKLSDEECAKLLADMKDIRSSIDEEDELSDYAKEGLSFGEKNFICDDSDATPKEYKECAKKLVNGQLSDVLETTEGCYIIKMNDNNSKDYYNFLKDNYDASYRKELFNAEYESLLSKYPVSADKDAVGSLRIGEMFFH